jgi:phospholipase/lecithinase/hemolysin
MDRRTFTVALLLSGLAVLSHSGSARADAQFSEIVVFGDSLAETGNLNLASGGVFAGPPYFGGRFSNGPLWVEVLADRLGLERPAPSLLGGTNYGWGGAGTGNGLSPFGTPNIGLQIDFFLDDRGGFEGDELIVVVGGTNDIIFMDAPARQIVQNLSAQITRLAASGGRTFVVLDQMAVGRAPLFRGTPDEVRIDTRAEEMNKLLTPELDRLEQRLGVCILRVKAAHLWDQILRHPGKFGFTNVTDPACPGCRLGIPLPNAADTIVRNPDEYAFWDFGHPTRVVHALIGELAFAAIAGDDDN